MSKYGPVIIACTFTWIGFVCAISFMEAWLKFRAPGITVPLGLGIGRLVFGALNRVEWVLMVATLVCVIADGTWRSKLSLLLPVLLVVLLIQTFWLLPILDARAQAHIDGTPPSPSNLHFYYVGMELVKVATLLCYGILVFRQLKVSGSP